jgi:NAD(P)-dependent dehydrogenase (short-subunit alcohol dehydrogenase family)
MNKICLITGATSGIGRAAAIELAKHGNELILVARNKSAGFELVNRITKKYGSNASFFDCDLSSLNGVKRLAEKIKENFNKIDVLINNAGARFDKYLKSEDDIELTFATNHLGHFLLTYYLIDLLKISVSARIINVSSSAHNVKDMPIDQLVNPKEYFRSAVYGRSKLANVLFTLELSNRLSNTKITVNTLDPGGVATRFAKNNGLLPWIKHIGYYLTKGSLLSAKKGAETIIYLAENSDVEGISGKFFYEKKEKPASDLAYNTELQKQLWQLSEKLCGINFK